MSHRLLDHFDARPDVELAIMTAGQSLRKVTTRAPEGLAAHRPTLRPDLVRVQGDTTSELAGALSALYHRVSVVGTREEDVVAAVQDLLDDAQAFAHVAVDRFPHGDGDAAGCARRGAA